MDFLLTYREPCEVYRAAIGDPSELTERLRSGTQLSDWDREAIALLLNGELIPPKNSPHNTPRALNRLRRAEIMQRRRNAVVFYRLIMSELKKSGEAYGASEKVIAYVAERDGISEESLRADIRRNVRNSATRRMASYKPKVTTSALLPVREFPKAEASRKDWRAATLFGFKNWCHLYWKDVQQFRRAKRT